MFVCLNFIYVSNILDDMDESKRPKTMSISQTKYRQNKLLDTFITISMIKYNKVLSVEYERNVYSWSKPSLLSPILADGSSHASISVVRFEVSSPCPRCIWYYVILFIMNNNYYVFLNVKKINNYLQWTRMVDLLALCRSHVLTSDNICTTELFSCSGGSSRDQHVSCQSLTCLNFSGLLLTK